MCGIVSILQIQGKSEELRKKALQLVKRIRHRGPDWSGIYADEHAILAHERLAIVDIEHGAQPLIDAAQEIVLAVNGEIYNHKELRSSHNEGYVFQTNSDCEVIIPLYRQQKASFLPLLNGIYAFTLYDKRDHSYMVARDPMGVIPLYWGWDAEGNRYVASEMKALIDVCNRIEEFPPGHVYTSGDDTLHCFYKPSWAEEGELPTTPFDKDELRNALEAAVCRQLMCDVPYGLLLSGGLDSSIISAIAAKFAKKRVENDGHGPAWWPQLHSFSIGLEGAPDLVAAKKVADHIGTIHHEVHFTIQEGLDALSDVIYHLETFDVTTIRAATPMYLLSRKIKAMGIKMLLSGEGADEMFGGYLYFHKAPNARAFHEETLRKLQQLYKYDCLRANKSTAAWGIEARVPFLDLRFLDTVMSIEPQSKLIDVAKGRMEKFILREAFSDMLPAEIVWRQKEQFSDGVGYAWIDGLQENAEHLVSSQMMANASHTFRENAPVTKEAYVYRQMFATHFPHVDAAACVPSGPSIACSTPTALEWDASFSANADPSGRAVLGVHQDGKSSDG